jgi:hypothetical protein
MEQKQKDKYKFHAKQWKKNWKLDCPIKKTPNNKMLDLRFSRQ